jgi:hypothetical protein
MPRARVTMAMAENQGDLKRARNAKRKSCDKLLVGSHRGTFPVAWVQKGFLFVENGYLAEIVWVTWIWPGSLAIRMRDSGTNL